MLSRDDQCTSVLVAVSSRREWVWLLTRFASRKWRSGLNRISHPDWVKFSVDLNCAPNQNTRFSSSLQHSLFFTDSLSLTHISSCPLSTMRRPHPIYGPLVRVFANGPGDLGSIPGRVIPKTLKMELDTTLLNTQHYKVRFKGKVEQSREWSCALPYTLV